MAQVVYRGNLSAKVFPFISEYFGQTIIVPGQDQNFQRQVVSSEDMDKDRGIPQILYCHNVMPSAEGFQSVGFEPAITDTKYGFTEIFTLRDTNGNEVFFAHTTDGNNYILPFGGTSWQQISSVGNATDVQISVATINGQSYVYFENTGCYMYDSVNNYLAPITLTGLDETQVIGITSSAGYMIAWTANSIAWSSTVEHVSPSDPIDFTPSLVTGAGGGNVEAAKGKITFCMPHYLGFIIYTTDNIVGAVYSGNARYPFNLREIVGSGGVSDPVLVAADALSGNHYAYTTSGLQLVSISQTNTVFPEVTDFISGKYFEDFDDGSLQFVRQSLQSTMRKALSVVADRYLIISYGITNFTHALVYDVIQKRFGKIKLNHVSAFEWKKIGTNVDMPKDSMGFLQQNGSIKTVNFGYGAASSNGTMLLGKYQLARTRLMTLEEVNLENIRADAANFKLYNYTTYDGKTLEAPVAGYLAHEGPAGRSYNFHQTGVNHTLLLQGNFYCSSIILKFHINGRR